MVQIALRSAMFDSDIPEGFVAKVIGHEIAHAIDKAKRDEKVDGSDRKIAENFADAFGCQLASDAGYNLKDVINFDKRSIEGMTIAKEKASLPTLDNSKSPIPSPEYKKGLIELFPQNDQFKNPIPNDIVNEMQKFTSENAEEYSIKRYDAEGKIDENFEKNRTKAIALLKASAQERKKLAPLPLDNENTHSDFIKNLRYGKNIKIDAKETKAPYKSTQINQNILNNLRGKLNG